MPGATRSRPHRRDIQGLRAVAVGLVVLDHAGWLPGGFLGVDVFFVLSGFLITGLLLAELERSGTISLRDFYARRARRILPAATLVALATLLGSVLVLGDVRTAEVTRDVVLVALFAINWDLAAQGADYFAQGADQSPFQHYWSLAVEEQFYLGWPLLVLGAALLATRLRGRGVRRSPALGLLVTAVVAISLAWSVSLTASTPEAAYFTTTTRVWELAAGAGLALLVPRLAALPAGLRTAAGWVGLAGLGLSLWVIDDTSAFPGVVALLPVGATCLLVAAGTPGSEAGPGRFAAGRLLGVAPLQWLGDRSYSLYLWHWPVLVLAEARLGREPTLLELVGAIGLAVLATMLTHTLVEVPFHTGRLRPARLVALAWWPASVAVLVTSVVVVGVNGPDLDQESEYFARVERAERASGKDFPTATRQPRRDLREAVERADEPVADELEPPLSELRGDTFHRTVDNRCYARSSDQTSHDVCTVGAHDGQDLDDVVVIGDSHAGMFLPAFDQIGQARGWRVHHLVKTGCTLADSPSLSREDCTQWREWAFDEVDDLAPDVVVMSTMAQDDFGEQWVAGMRRSAERLQASGADVVVLGETPWLDREEDLVACLDTEGATPADCEMSLDPEVTRILEAQEELSDELGLGFVNPLPWLCREERCPTVVDDQVVYYFRGHLTVTFVHRLARALNQKLRTELDRIARS
ncbi:acyltransferase family protein [Nocardioides sp. 31GB23]|uniref:acyltransferase family protein n=1 Tax=Nocardioides sp. 31GB23 TaxID=3156065 RepID=UPI0032AEA739